MRALCAFLVADASSISQSAASSARRASVAVKSIAERRGWNHNRHGLLYDISGQIADELGRPELRVMFRSANAMHQNYYEDWMASDEVGDGIQIAKEYLRALEAAQAQDAATGFVPETAEQASRLRRLMGG